MTQFMEQKLYLPMPVALTTGALDLGSINPATPQEAALNVGRGRMPDNAGVVSMPGGIELGAFDFVDVNLVGRQITVAPLPKDAVDGETGSIRSMGTVAVCTPETVRPFAEVLPWRMAQWHDGFRQVGHVGIRHLGIDTRWYEITDTDGRGAMTAIIPQRYF